ncbi:DUF3551 domain-containing protein [Bradyrhizobium neotropicale]|uniref:DUF3551 domain-containing protein n=1 Tax=Bradyrhizobium neotropicale TaxID=1497615 RepID=A0A176YR19_9BRAD|nr:DUF3551 domain-containing protein [Bradyrhizobium neotropicale]OAF08887.1 hypothetical protein AXW67_27015 [Bradyrhizobium neotropicale]
MRKTQLALGALVLAGLAGIEPARADYDYPWCIQGAAYDYPGDCSYQTREQCLASVSGRKGYCGQNPAFLLARPPLQPSPRGRRFPPA